LPSQSLFTHDDLLFLYKKQPAERGFRFLKDPFFFTPTVFLDTEERIAALAFIMALALLIYSLAQRILRLNLDAQQQTIRHQSAKQTNKPTFRWVCQLFQGVHLLTINANKRISNLSAELKHILSFFPKSCSRYYLLI